MKRSTLIASLLVLGGALWAVEQGRGGATGLCRRRCAGGAGVVNGHRGSAFSKLDQTGLPLGSLTLYDGATVRFGPNGQISNDPLRRGPPSALIAIVARHPPLVRADTDDGVDRVPVDRDDACNAWCGYGRLGDACDRAAPDRDSRRRDPNCTRSPRQPATNDQ